MTGARWKRWGALGAVAFSVWGFGNLYQPTVVVGASMAPTLQHGQVIWVDRCVYRTRPPRRGEVVVFQHEGATYVKRVHRGPGEPVYYLKSAADWVRLIDDRHLERVKARLAGYRSMLRVATVQVPRDAVFVLGDNISASEDSRHFGPIPIRAIVGRAHVEVDRAAALHWQFVPKRPRTAPRRAEARTLPGPERDGSSDPRAIRIRDLQYGDQATGCWNNEPDVPARLDASGRRAKRPTATTAALSSPG